MHDCTILPPFPFALKSDATQSPLLSLSGFEYLKIDFSSLGSKPNFTLLISFAYIKINS